MSNLLTIYEPRIDKKELKEKIQEALQLYSSASGADKDEMTKRLIVYSKTLEKALSVGYSGMTDLYDEKCDLEEENVVLREQNESLKALLSKECERNPDLINQFDKINTVTAPSTKGRRDYNEMIDKYILKAKSIKN